MINRLWAWITGYVIIKMKGAQLEALINRIAGHGFGIWDLERVTANIMIGKIRIRQFKRLRPLLGGLNVRVGIVGRAGLPFFSQIDEAEWADCRPAVGNRLSLLFDRLCLGD